MRDMSHPIRKRIENDFTYHRPPADKIEDFHQLRHMVKNLAHYIVDVTPAGREQSNALTKLEEAMFHANAAIARQFPQETFEPKEKRVLFAKAQLMTLSTEGRRKLLEQTGFDLNQPFESRELPNGDFEFVQG